MKKAVYYYTKPLIEYMKTVPDPRCPREKKHDHAEILTYLIAGYVTGHTTVSRALKWARRHEKWLKTWLCIRNGIASASTVSRLLTRMDEEMFILAFTGWVGEILRSRGLHIAIDGKALRAGMSKVTGSKSPMILSAVDAATGIVLTQLPIKDKESEVTKIPKLLGILDIRGSVITTDAIGTTTGIMRYIKGSGGHFVQIIKKNQPVSYDEIRELFEILEKEQKKEKETPGYQSGYSDFLETYQKTRCFEINRDRHEHRAYEVCHNTSMLKKTQKEWPFLITVGRIRQTRILVIRDSEGRDITPNLEQFQKEGTYRQPIPTTGDSERDTTQVIGVISDLKITGKEMGKYRRSHWTIENRLHHVLDDTFREDRSPAKGSKNNLALVRKFAYNILRIVMIQQSIEEPMTEVMDLLSDNLDLLGKYIFNGIQSFY